MRRLTLGLSVGILVLVVAFAANASLNDFLGNWQNTDSNTGGVTRLEIASSGSSATVHAWGKCTPSDCDWGTRTAVAYGPSAGSSMPGSASALLVVFPTGFSETTMIIRPAGSGRIEAQIYTRFTDGSGRSNYSNTYNFKRSIQLAPGGLAPGHVIVPVLTAPTQVSPPNGSVFGHFPRTTTLNWSPVNGAASYTVEVDCYQCCQANKWCTDVGQTWKVVPNITSTSYTFDFVGAQPGRWRVWAVGSGGAQGPKTGWWEFRYTR